MAVDVVAIDVPGGDPGRMLQHEPDEALAALVRQGHESAFVVIYDRHHRGLIAFCRHMLSSKEEAEDALQHTFFAAYHALTGGGTPPRALKPWLYTIARNRCLTVLRARRPHETTDEDTDGGAVVIGLAEEVQRRSDLRDLVADLHRLPEDQKAALVLFEMGDLSHAEIAETLSVTREKVKALVFQAREGLLRARSARDTPCAEIRHEVSSRTRPLPRRGVVRGHLDRCPSCAAYDLEVRRQRAALAIILPVVPSLELKGSVLGPMLGGGATVAGGSALIAGGAGAGGAGLGGTGLGGAGAAATVGAGAGAGAGAAGGAAAGAGGVAGLATSASGIAGAASGIGALAAKTVVAKALTVVAVAAAAAGTGKVAEEVHQHASRPAHAVPAKTTGAAPSVVTSSDPTITTALPASHTTITTVTSTAAAVATPATTTSTSSSEPTGTTASAPSSSSTSPSSTPSASGGGAATAPAQTAADPATGGTSAPAGAAATDPAPAASTPAASDPSPSSTNPPAATQNSTAVNDPAAVSADAVAPLGSANDPGTGATTASDPNAAIPPGCPTVADPSASTVPPAITTDPSAAAPPDANAAADPGAAGAAAQCPPLTPAAGSSSDPAAGATTTAGVTSATPAP